MDWAKLMSDYYRDLAIAVGGDPEEVMFTRGIALAAELESGGFIPDQMLHTLCRKPQNAVKVAANLVAGVPSIDIEGLWDRVPGGYQIRNWARIQAELEKLVAKKKADAARKRRERATARKGAASVDASTDSPAPRPEDSLYESESETKTKTAAAAAVGAAAADGQPALPVSVGILRSRLQAHTPLRALRFDKLSPGQVTQIEALIEVHGDQRLVDVAISTLRSTPPVSVAAFIGTWTAMPPPGTPLALVEQRFCDQLGHNLPLDSAGVCRLCASESKAAK